MSAEDKRLHARLDRLARIVMLLKRLAKCRYGWELDAVLGELEDETKQRE